MKVINFNTTHVCLSVNKTKSGFFFERNLKISKQTLTSKQMNKTHNNVPSLCHAEKTSELLLDPYENWL